MRLSIIILILAAASPIGSAYAATCNPSSKAELAALISAHSPFNGNWSVVRNGRTYSGPINISSTQHQGVLRVQSSDRDKKLNEPGLVEVTFLSPRNLTFQKNGKFTLSLNPDCTLTGNQAHRNGPVSIHLN